jgi:hypothetical protein
MLLNKLGPFQFQLLDRTELRPTLYPYKYAEGQYFPQRIAKLTFLTKSGSNYGNFEVPLLQFFDHFLRVFLQASFRSTPGSHEFLILDYEESLQLSFVNGDLSILTDTGIQLLSSPQIEMLSLLSKYLGAEVKLSAEAGWLGSSQLYSHDFVMPISFSEDLGNPIGS